MIFVSHHEPDEFREIKGHFGPFFEAIVRLLNASYELRWEDPVNIGHVTGPENGTGLIGHLLRNESDFSVFPIPLSYEAYKYLDFTSTLDYYGWKIFSIRPAPLQVHYLSSFEIFDMEVWIYFLLSFLLTGGIYHLATHLARKYCYKPGIQKICLNLLSAITQESYDVPDHLSARTLYTFWSVATALLGWGFCGCLLSSLTVPKLPDSIEKLSDVPRFPGIGLYVPDGTEIARELKESMLPEMKMVNSFVKKTNGYFHWSSEEDFFKAAFEVFGGKMAIVVPRDFAFEGIPKYEFCDVAKVLYVAKEYSFFENYYLGMRKDLHFGIKEKLKEIVFMFAESGLIRQSFSKEAYKGDNCYTQSLEPEISIKALGFVQIALPMVYLCVGAILALIALLIELHPSGRGKKAV